MGIAPATETIVLVIFFALLLLLDTTFAFVTRTRNERRLACFRFCDPSSENDKKKNDAFSLPRRHDVIPSLARPAKIASLVAIVSIAKEVKAETTVEAPVAIDDVVKFAKDVEDSRPLNSDEFIATFNGEGLGLKLVETIYKGFPVVTVKEIKDRTGLPNELIPGVILIKVNDAKVDGLPLKTISDMIRVTAKRPIKIKFRDPNTYFRLLDSTLGPPKKLITTSYLPANTRDPGAPEQIIRIERLTMPPPEDRRRAAQFLDVLEIQYACQVLQGGQFQELGEESSIVDSSASRAAPGTSAKSVYYILGQQNGPPGTKLPPGWDLTLPGMVVGEKRRITLPYTLGYDRKGDKRLNIPPFSTLVYTVKLLSIT